MALVLVRWAADSGSWGTSSNWAGGAVPASGDEAVLGGSGAYTVTYSGFASVGAIRITDPEATLAFTGSQAFLTINHDIIGAGANAAPVELTGSQAYLDMLGSQLINHVTIDIGNGSDISSSTRNGAHGIVTLGSDTVINDVGGNGPLLDGGLLGHGFVNDGTINAAVAGRPVFPRGVKVRQ